MIAACRDYTEIAVMLAGDALVEISKQQLLTYRGRYIGSLSIAIKNKNLKIVQAIMSKRA